MGNPADIQRLSHTVGGSVQGPGRLLVDEDPVLHQIVPGKIGPAQEPYGVKEEKVSSRSHRVHCKGPVAAGDLHLSQAAVAQGKEPGRLRHSQSLLGYGSALQDLLQLIVELRDILFLKGLRAAVKAADLGGTAVKPPSFSFSLIVERLCKVAFYDADGGSQQQKEQTGPHQDHGPPGTFPGGFCFIRHLHPPQALPARRQRPALWRW